MRAVGDVLDIVDAAYDLRQSDSAWLEGIGAACQPLLDSGHGLCVFEFEFRPGQGPRILQAKMLGMPAALEAVYPTVFMRMDSDTKTKPFAHGPCTTASQMLGLRAEFRLNPLMQEYAHHFGIVDSLWITAAEPSGRGIGLHAGRSQIGRASSSTISLWARIGSHLSAGARLRRKLASIENEMSSSAIFNSNGKPQHIDDGLDADSVQRLRTAVKELGEARTLTRGSFRAKKLNLRKGLVDGTWSLIDRFESDGKRYIVAEANQPVPSVGGELTLRERQVVGYAALGHDNKVIAYDLGISHSTVRVLMARAAAKLGVKSRETLIAAYSALDVSIATPEKPPTRRVNG